VGTGWLPSCILLIEVQGGADFHSLGHMEDILESVTRGRYDARPTVTFPAAQLYRVYPLVCRNTCCANLQWLSWHRQRLATMPVKECATYSSIMSYYVSFSSVNEHQRSQAVTQASIHYFTAGVCLRRGTQLVWLMISPSLPFIDINITITHSYI